MRVESRRSTTKSVRAGFALTFLNDHEESVPARRLRSEATSCSALGARLRWRVKLFGNAKPPHDELVNLQSLDSGATDCQPADGYGTDGQCADRDRTQRQRAKCSRCDDAHRSVFPRAGSADFSRQAAGQIPEHGIANTECHGIVPPTSFRFSLRKRGLTLSSSRRERAGNEGKWCMASPKALDPSPDNGLLRGPDEECPVRTGTRNVERLPDIAPECAHVGETDIDRPRPCMI